MSNITEALGMIETKGLVASVEAADAMRGRVMMSPSAAQAEVVTKMTASLSVLPREHPLFARAKQPLDTALRRARSTCEQCRMNGMATFEAASINDGYLDEIRKKDSFCV